MISEFRVGILTPPLLVIGTSVPHFVNNELLRNTGDNGNSGQDVIAIFSVTQVRIRHWNRKKLNRFKRYLGCRISKNW